MISKDYFITEMSQNPVVNPDIYEPRNFTISNIEKVSHQTLVTLDDDCDYVIGQLVRFHIPIPYGMRQINEELAYVVVINSSNQFTCDIDSTYFDSFVSSPTYPGNTLPQISAIGDKNISTSGLTLTGAFGQS